MTFFIPEGALRRELGRYLDGSRDDLHSSLRSYSLDLTGPIGLDGVDRCDGSWSYFGSGYRIHGDDDCGFVVSSLLLDRFGLRVVRPSAMRWWRLSIALRESRAHS